MIKPTNAVVLVVDVDDDLRATICEVLSEAGYQPTCVSDFEAARAKLPGNPPDVLLMSWDSYASAQEKAEFLHDMPHNTVVIMSTQPLVATVAEKLGIAFVPKPFDLDEFLETMDRSSRPPPTEST